MAAAVVVQAGPHLIISSDPLPLRRSIISGSISNLTAKITIAHVFSTPAAVVDGSSASNEWDGNAVFKLPAYMGVLAGLEVTILGSQKISVPALISRKQDVEALPECVELKNHIPFESPDLCLVSVENLPRGVDVEIRATFATELLVDGSNLALILPTVLVPTKYKHSTNSTLDSIVKAPGTQSFELVLDLQLELFGAIASVTSPSKHPILFVPTPPHPVKGQNLMSGHISIRPGVTDTFSHCGDLVLMFELAQPVERLLPRCFLEHVPGKDHPIVAMLAFKPKAHLQPRACEIAIVVDTAQQAAKLPFMQQALRGAINEIRDKYAASSTKIYFNLVLMTGNGLLSAMGGRAQLLREQDTFDKVLRFIDFEMGKYYDGFIPPRKDFLKSVEDLFTLPKAEQLPRQVILITTGQIALPDTDALLEVIRIRGNVDDPASPCSGVFTVGIGSSHCNFNTLQSIGKVLGGTAEFVWDATDLDQARAKIVNQVRRALQPPMQNVRVEWDDTLETDYEVVQTPDPMLSFYSEDLVCVYALLRNEPEPGIYEVELVADALQPALPPSAPASPAPGSPDTPLNVSQNLTASTDGMLSPGGSGPHMQIQQVNFKQEDVELEIEFLEDVDSDSSSSEADSEPEEDGKPPAKKPIKKSAPQPHVRPGMLPGPNIHILAMTERIFDIEDSVTPDDEAASYKEVVDLATSYNFTSNYTAFFATQLLKVPGSDNDVVVTVMSCEAAGDPEEPVEETGPVKLKYNLDFMLQYRDQCLERPEGLPMIKGVTESRPRGSADGMNGHIAGPGAKRGHHRAGASPVKEAGGKAPSRHQTPAKAQPKTPALSHRRHKSRGGPVPDRKALVVKGNWESKQVLGPAAGAAGSSAAPVNTEAYAALFKKFQSDLNKLTRDNFDRLSAKLIALGREEIKDVEALRGTIGMIFETAVAQPKFATMYSDLCVVLARTFPEFDTDGTLHLPPPDAPLASSGMIPTTPGGPGQAPRISFKRILLNRCQLEFENSPKPEQIAQILAALPADERDEKELKIRTRALSNMTFVGELYNKSMLSSKIIVAIIQGLFGSMSNPPTDPTPENLEMANKLLRGVGKLLDTQVSELLDRVMMGCRHLSKHSGLDSRIRFMLLDLVELRGNEWVPREQQADLKPKTIKEIHEDMRQKEREELEKEREQMHSSSSAIGRSPARTGGKPLAHSIELATPSRPTRGGLNATSSPRSPSQFGSNSSSGNSTPKRNLQSPQAQQAGGSTWKARPPSPGAPGSPLSASTSSIPVKSDSEEAGFGNERRKLFSTEKSWAAAAKEGGSDRKALTSSAAAPLITVTNDAGKTAAPTGSTPFQPSGRVYNEEEIESNVQLFVDEFLTANDAGEAINCLKELKASKKDDIIVQKIILDSFEKKESAREKSIELLNVFVSAKEISAETLTDVFQKVLEDIEDFAIDIPFSPIYLGQYIGDAILNGVAPLSDLADWVAALANSGTAEKIATGAFKQIATRQSVDQLQKLYKESGLEFKTAFLAKKHQGDAKYWDNFLQSGASSFASIFA